MKSIKSAKKVLAFIWAGALTAGLPVCSVPVAASQTETAYFAELTKDLEADLTEENDSVAFQNTAVQAAPVYVRGGEAAPTADQFFADLKNSYDARLSVLNRYSYFETMKENTYNEYRFLCAEAERPFYEAYDGVSFDDKNIQFLCDAYMRGLSTQYEAEMMWREDGSPEEIEAFYLEGYDQRAEVLKEISAFYQTSLAIDNVNSTVDIAKIVENAIAKNKEGDKQVITQVQTRLNELGYACGSADGQAGQKTVLAICHFQMASGQTPDGIADQKLLDQMNR